MLTEGFDSAADPAVSLGRDPDYTAGYACDAASVLIAAIRNAGLNRVRIRDAVRALSPFPGVMGTIEWDGQGRNRKAVSLSALTGAR